MIFEINTIHHYKFMCPLYIYMESFHVIIMIEHYKFHLSIIPHP
jgi:hypothetical protein